MLLVATNPKLLLMQFTPLEHSCTPRLPGERRDSMHKSSNPRIGSIALYPPSPPSTLTQPGSRGGLVGRGRAVVLRTTKQGVRVGRMLREADELRHRAQILVEVVELVNARARTTIQPAESVERTVDAAVVGEIDQSVTQIAARGGNRVRERMLVRHAHVPVRRWGHIRTHE